MSSLFEPVRFQRGPAMANRFVLAPLTNSQSHADGTLSEAEQHWLTLRADGGFGMVMTCAAHVQAAGQGFPGQLGIFGDRHLPGLTGLAEALNARGAVSVVQLHHAGMRSPAELIGEAPHCPSVNEEFGARALTEAEVEQVVEDFVAAAVRAERAGFHGVELHGAHGYLLCQFLSAETNRREDDWGGSLEGRARILFEIVRGIRARCSADFLLGVRLSPERFGMELGEVLEVAQRLIDTGDVDFLDLSLWDCFKEPELPAYQGRSLLSWFMDLERRAVKLGPAGKIRTAADAQRVLDAGADFVVLGRAAILHHDYPARLAADPAFLPAELPVTAAWLEREGLSPPFVNYMRNWKGFVAD
ncbi:MAG: NADH:flavin oxidoreductase [Pseudomonadales bacterium]|jgi:2,4-dienoyl-CoA reductase-like NADH-dependent reductase (Old Yellow Enzyme family)|nr:NADH:flavin oxidoreductase [Pseudomonadales bacterium]